jgi:exonuclease SbcC
VQITHLSVRNIRSHPSADLDLGPGTTLLIGDIGSGKTSLLYAVELALLGFAEVEPAFLVRHRAKDAEVALTLEGGGHRWQLRRRFVRKTRKGKDSFEPEENSLAVDGQRRAYSATELRRETIELLGFPDNPNPRARSDVWRWAVYIAQERMRDVLDPDKERRLDTVRKALGVEQYRVAAENARGVGRTLRDRGLGYSEQVARESNLEREIDAWTGQRSQAEASLAEALARETAAQSAYAETDRRWKQAEEERQRREGRRQELELLRGQADEIDRALGRQRAEDVTIEERMDAARRGIAECEEVLRSRPGVEAHQASRIARRRELQRELESLQEDRTAIAALDAQWDDLEKTWPEARHRVAELEREREATQRQVRRLEDEEPRVAPEAPSGDVVEVLEDRRAKELIERRRLDRSLADSEHELRELTELIRGGSCPRCHRPVGPDDFRSHRDEAATHADAIRTSLSESDRKIEALDRAIERRRQADLARERWEQLEARRTEVRDQLRRLDLALAREREVLARVEADRSSVARERESRAPQAARQSALAIESAELEAAIADGERRLRELTGTAETARGMRSQLEILTARKTALAEEIQAATRRRAEAGERIRALEADALSAPEPEAAWAALREARERARVEVDSCIRATEKVRAEIDVATARLESLRERHREREDLRARSAHLARLAAWFEDAFGPALIELEKRRLAQARGEFERRFSAYFATLVDDPALLARVDETFAPWVDAEGQRTPPEALSGGERTALALAFRLALGRVIRDAGRMRLETIILDEPTEGFSQEQTLRMGELLEELAFPQVLLVSHEPQLAAVADRIIRVQKTDGRSALEDAQRTPVAADADRPRVRADEAIEETQERAPETSGSEEATRPRPTETAGARVGSRRSVELESFDSAP